MFILKKGHQPGVNMPLRALFLVFLPSFSIFPFFDLSLQSNEYGNFRQRFLRNYLI